MEFTHKVSQEDILNINFFIQKKIGRWEWNRDFLLQSLVLLFLVGVMNFNLSGGFSFLYFSLECLGVLALSFAVMSYKRSLLRKKIIQFANVFYEQERKNLNLTYVLHEDSIEEKSKKNNQKINFKDVQNVFKTEENFFVCISQMKAFVFPINEESEGFIKNLCQMAKKDLEFMKISGYKNKIWG